MISSTQNSSKRKFSKRSKCSIDDISMKNRRDRSIESIPRLFRSFSKGIFTEVNCRNLSESILDELAQRVYQFVQNQSFSSRSFDGHPLEFLSADSRRSTIYKSFVNETFLERNVYRIYLGDFDEKSTRKVDLHSMNIILYKTTDENPFVHELIVEGEKQSFGCRWKLPHQQFESIWESLEFDLPIKSQLINYVFTLIRFDKAKIDRNIVQCNQTILLYGPPGCGKTSLCKGLAEKVSIRMKEYFHRFYFYELNSSALFSKWFSESSHNLSRFFDEILRLSSDSETFVMILIDEIESLSLSRTSTLNSNEPSDMLRVVNTLLTQIDRLKSTSNVLIFTTSNLIEILDQALIDRTDLILFIGPPSISTIYHIYRDCFQEFIEKNLLNSNENLSSADFNEKLLQLSKLTFGLSGRTIRKLPLIAFSHLQPTNENLSIDQFLFALKYQLDQQKTNHFD